MPWAKRIVGPITGLDRSGGKLFVDFVFIFIALDGFVGFAGGFVFKVGSHGSFGYGFRFEIYDNLLWLRLFEFDALEIGRGDLERVEQEAGGFPFDSLLQDHLHDLANDALNGMRIFKKRQDDFAGRVLTFGVTLDWPGTILVMVETEILAAESG